MYLTDYLVDDNGKKSLSKLLKLWAWPPATIVMVYIHTTEAMALYLSAFVVDTAFTKGMDTIKTVKNKQTEGATDVANAGSKTVKK